MRPCPLCSGTPPDTRVTTVHGLLGGWYIKPWQTVFGGANVPMLITAALESDEDDATLKESIINEGQAAIREFVLDLDDEEDDL